MFVVFKVCPNNPLTLTTGFTGTQRISPVGCICNWTAVTRTLSADLIAVMSTDCNLFTWWRCGCVMTPNENFYDAMLKSRAKHLDLSQQCRPNDSSQLSLSAGI